MLNAKLRTLVNVALETAQKINDQSSHTVAAALLTKGGNIVTGINSYHFLGGPCAEVTALAKHSEHSPNDPVLAIVAAYGPTNCVIPPCGKCRQVLYDLDPHIQCIVRTPNGFEAIPVMDLLPYPYNWTEAENVVQNIFMWEGYESAIRGGTKRQTIRVDDPFSPGPANIIFEKESGETVTISATVTRAREVKRKELSEIDALRDGFSNLNELQNALDFHYPSLKQDDPVLIISFELV